MKKGGIHIRGIQWLAAHGNDTALVFFLIPVKTHGPEFPGVVQAEELRVERSRQMPNFVEDSNSTIFGPSKNPVPLSMRTSKGSFHMTEQFTVDDCLGQIGTAENAVGASGNVGDQLGQKFLTGASFPNDQFMDCSFALEAGDFCLIPEIDHLRVPLNHKSRIFSHMKVFNIFAGLLHKETRRSGNIVGSIHGTGTLLIHQREGNAGGSRHTERRFAIQCLTTCTTAGNIDTTMIARMTREKLCSTAGMPPKK